MMSEIATRKMTELELASQAKAELDRLEGRKRQLMCELDETQKAVTDASAKVERTRFVAQRNGVLPEPPIPSFDEMLAEAQKQCPHRDPKELNAMVSRLHAAATGTSRIGVNVQAPMSAVYGEDVRNIDDHHYDVPPAEGPGGPVDPKVDFPAGSKFIKTYV